MIIVNFIIFKTLTNKINNIKSNILYIYIYIYIGITNYCIIDTIWIYIYISIHIAKDYKLYYILNNYIFYKIRMYYFVYVYIY